MKLTLLFTFIGFYAFSQKLDKINRGQLYYLQFSDYEYNTTRIHYMNNSNALKNNVKEFFRFKTNKKGEKILVEYKSFNKKGLLQKDSTRQRVISYYYNDTLLIKTENKTSKTSIIRELSYNEKNLISKISVFSNNKKTIEKVYTYNEFGKVTEIKNILFSKKGKQDEYRLEREYNSKGKTSKERYYENDVLKRSWNYECNDKGTLNEPNKKIEMTSSVCKFEEEANDGSYKIFERIIYSGKVYLNERSYTKDSILIQEKRFYNETELINERNYEKSRTTQINYSKGKIRNKSITYRDENKNLISQINYDKKGKTQYYYHMYYNNLNLIEKEVNSFGTSIFTYTYY